MEQIGENESEGGLNLSEIVVTKMSDDQRIEVSVEFAIEYNLV